MPITVRFKERTGNGPIADAVIEFHGPEYGPFSGQEINGFAVWAGKEGKPYATVPSREYSGKDGERKRWEFVRLQSDPNLVDSQKWAVKNFIVAEWEKQQGGGVKTDMEVPF